ncbi:hypothetical protein [Miltoncostaea oceani]|uniref:hypothetical protein n=1 Tax=Miltoncostaea oceani TaxID=2843216 RepID=UPI001C3C3D2D|nr:hypothetical protein [Miltoncostaea oceani]
MARGRSVRSALSTLAPPARYLDDEIPTLPAQTEGEFIDAYGLVTAAGLHEALSALPTVASTIEAYRAAGARTEAELYRGSYIVISQELLRRAALGHLDQDDRTAAACAAARQILGE